jgi:hypothetical protein
MNRDARLMSGILLVTVPTIQYGGYFLLRLFSGQMPGTKPSPLQTSFFRAGHAHAGVLVILSLICQILVEHAALGPEFAWLVRIGVPLAAILCRWDSFSRCRSLLIARINGSGRCMRERSRWQSAL